MIGLSSVAVLQCFLSGNWSDLVESFFDRFFLGIVFEERSWPFPQLFLRNLHRLSTDGEV